MDEKLKLIRIHPEDGDLFLHVYDFVVEHHFTPKHLIPEEDLLKDPSISTYFVRDEEDEGIIATASMKKWSPTLVEMQRTIVHDAYRGRGLGKKLATAMEEKAEELGFKKIWSFTYTTNFPMIFLRLKMGYLIEGLLRDSDAPGIHEYVFGKEI